MQITKLRIDNFLQIRSMDMDMSGSVPVHLIAGHNESGKSSIHEAIRFAMLGETARVSLKRDYPKMIRMGSRSGMVGVDFIDDNGDHDFVERDVKSGKVTDGYTGDPEFAIAEVMDATKYPYYDSKHQRKILSRLLNINIDRNEVAELLKRKKIPDDIVEQVLPMLRAGFESAHKDAKSKQSEHRAKWEQLTCEKWGAQKGLDWEPEKRPVGQGMMNAQKRTVEKYKKAHEKSLEKIGETKQYQGGASDNCPGCGVKLLWTGQELQLHNEDSQSKEALKTGTAARDEANNLGGLYEQELQSLQKMQRDMDFNNSMAESKKESLQLHDQILTWMKTADELAADGIPGEIITNKLKPVNERLRNTAIITTWDQVTITPVMEIVIGTLPYSLCSESAQWRAQAAIAEAISYIAEIGILCLDRFDVLDLPNRARMMKWIHKVSSDHKTILLFGTLKEPPKKLPDTMCLHWLEDGVDTTTRDT